MSTHRDAIGEIHNYGIDVKNREIYINEFDDSGESAGVDHRMLQNFIKNINFLKNQNKEPITIHLQTIGGCWYSGMGIYDAIKNCKCRTTVIGYSQVCSMGTIIMQAANKRLLTPNAVFMVHWGNSEISGHYLASQNLASFEKHLGTIMVNIYSEKCEKTGAYFKEREFTLSKVKAFLKRKMAYGDWYMTSDEAIDYGFTDGIHK
jgi:ATP-dependent protease ClpP protease subunit